MKTNWYGAIVIAIIAVLCVAAFVTLTRQAPPDPDAPREMKPPSYTYLASHSRDERRCIAEWTDINGHSHCGHTLKWLTRMVDSTGAPYADVFHCFTDSARVALPIPRYFYAETATSGQ